MSIHILQGEAKEIAQLHSGVRIRITGGPLRLSHIKSEAVNGNAPLYPEGLSTTLQRGFDGPVWAYAPEADVTLEVDKEGFGLTNAFMDLIGVDGTRQKGEISTDITTQSVGDITTDISSVSVGDVPISLDAVGVGSVPIDIQSAAIGTVPVDIDSQSIGSIDADITAQTIGNIGIDIAEQSGGNVDSNNARIQALDVTELNGDNTTTIAPGESDTTTVRAASGDVYDLYSTFIQAHGINNNSGIYHPFKVRIETEAEGIGLFEAESQVKDPVGHPVTDTRDAGVTFDYNTVICGNNTFDDLRNTRIDDTNGLVITWESTFPLNTEFFDDFETGDLRAWTGDTSKFDVISITSGWEGDYIAETNSTAVENYSMTYDYATNPGEGWVLHAHQYNMDNGNTNDYVKFEWKDSGGTVLWDLTWYGDGTVGSNFPYPDHAPGQVWLSFVHEKENQSVIVSQGNHQGDGDGIKRLSLPNSNELETVTVTVNNDTGNTMTFRFDTIEDSGYYWSETKEASFQYGVTKT